MITNHKTKVTKLVISLAIINAESVGFDTHHTITTLSKKAAIFINGTNARNNERNRNAHEPHNVEAPERRIEATPLQEGLAEFYQHNPGATHSIILFYILTGILYAITTGSVAVGTVLTHGVAKKHNIKNIYYYMMIIAILIVYPIGLLIHRKIDPFIGSCVKLFATGICAPGISALSQRAVLDYNADIRGLI